MISSKLRKINKQAIRAIILMMVLISSGILVSQDVNAQMLTRTYFRFIIPTNADGTRVSYSPDYYGRMDKSPKNVTVVYYNDKEGYGYAYTTDTFDFKQAVVTTAKEADDVLATAKDEVGVYYGEKIATRWYPEIKIEELKVDEKDNVVTEKTEGVYSITTKKAVVCPTCGSFIFWYYDGLLSSRQVITCPLGHKLLTLSYDTVDVKSVEIVK